MKSEEVYPRTLIVGVHFSEQSGSGTYLRRLFSGWPVDHVATICGATSLPDWSRCSRHYRTGDSEFRLQALFKRFVPAIISGPVFPVALDSTLEPRKTPSRSISHRIAQSSWRLLLFILGGGEILYKVGPSPKLVKWALDFQAEVIYGHFSSLNSLRFLLRMQHALDIPLVLHFMDDFPEALYRNGFASRYLRKIYLSEFSALVHSADVAIAICQEMAEEYEKRYQRKVLSLPMPVEIDAYQTETRTQWVSGQPFRLRYGGRVGWAIRESLADVAGVIHKLWQDGVDVTFDLATFQKDLLPGNCINLRGVNIQRPGPLADLPRLQAAADILLICYDFDPVSFREARYSMPSKLADCLASGSPILVYGPAGLPVVEYARRGGWGKVVDIRDSKVLREAICELMEKSSLREQLGKTAKRLANEIHDAKIVSESLRTIMQKAIAGKT